MGGRGPNAVTQGDMMAAWVKGAVVERGHALKAELTELARAWLWAVMETGGVVVKRGAPGTQGQGTLRLQLVLGHREHFVNMPHHSQILLAQYLYQISQNRNLKAI